METKRFSRKSKAFLFMIAVFFCSVQSLSFAQAPTLIVSEPASLTEETLDNSIVKLTIVGDVFTDDIDTNRVSVVPRNLWGIRVDDVKRLSDTEISVRLRFGGNFDRDRTLTLSVDAWGLENYRGEVTATIPIIVTIESLTATATPPFLTEATLQNSTVTLTLRGRTFKADAGRYTTSVTVSGISGVTVSSIKRLSDTELAVRLSFDGQDFDHDRTLTFTITDRSIKNYHHIPLSLTSPDLELTATLPVSATVERQTPVAPTPQPQVVTTPQPQVVSTPQPQVVTTPQPQVVSTPQPTVVRIPDPNLRGAIQNEIGNTITTQTLLNLTFLDAYDLGITNLTGLEHAENLSELELDSNSISDISALRGLTQLKSLVLGHNNISDISALRGLTQLESLVLGYNNISDISALAGLTRLTDLSLRENNISDISPLAGLTQLTDLVLGGNNITDISVLSGMTQLTGLSLWDNNISDISALAGLTQLTDLVLSGNNITDISALAGLTQLKSLVLGHNNISDISALVGLTQLTDLDLTDNPLPVAVDNSQVDTRTPIVPIDPSQPAIYWTTGSEIQRANLDGSNVQTLVEGGDPFKLTLDVTGEKMYWINRDSIQRANLDESNVQTLVRVWGIPIPEFTLDVAGGKIYWIVRESRPGSFLSSKILRANLDDGSNVETLWERKPYAKGLTLDVSGGKMYWIDTDTEDGERWWSLTRSEILRANLDGSNIETLRATEGWDYIEALALDVPGGKMYWFTDSDEAIRRANLDGSNVQTLVQQVNNLMELTLDVAGGKMYWTTYGGTVQRANLDGSNVQTLVREKYASSLTLDVATGKMYWIGMDGGADKIRRANLDGSNIENIIATPIGSFTLSLSQTPADDASPVAVRKTTQIHVDAADRPPMYWIDTAAGTLHRLVGAEVENLVPSVRNATSLTLDVANDKLYWTEKTSHNRGRIRSANIDGANVRLVKDLTSVPLDITFNPADDQLYLTNGWGKVQGLNVDGSGFQSNLITGLDTPMNIVVDVDKAKLYWTEETSHSAGRIRSANIDGSNVQLVKNLASIPVDMALDAADGKLYLTNTSGQVQGLNVDGSGHQPNFITGLDTQMHIAVDTAGQKLYLTSSDGKISRQDFSGGGPEDVATGLGNPGRLVLGVTPTAARVAATPATTDRAEDVNQDGKVDEVDLGMVAAALFGGNPPATLGRLDVNGDGKLTIDDLTQVSNNLDEEDAAAAPTLGIPLTALARDKIQAYIDLLLATDDGSLGVQRTLAYLQNLLASARPDETVLLANYPNPFNPETWIPYELSTDSDVRITIYDVRGQVVRRLVLGYQSAGYYTSRSRAAYWDGRNAFGEPVASGVYFYTLTAGDFTATRKMLIRK